MQLRGRERERATGNQHCHPPLGKWVLSLGGRAKVLFFPCFCLLCSPENVPQRCAKLMAFFLGSIATFFSPACCIHRPTFHIIGSYLA